MKKKVEDWLTQTRACRPRKGSFSSAGSCRLAWSVPGCTVPPVCSWNGPEEDDAASVVWPQTECGMDTHKMCHGHRQVWTQTDCCVDTDTVWRGHRHSVMRALTERGVTIYREWRGHDANPCSSWRICHHFLWVYADQKDPRCVVHPICLSGVGLSEKKHVGGQLRSNAVFNRWNGSDSIRHFWNWCDIYKVAKVVHGNRLDNHCNWWDTWPSILPPGLY